MESNDKKDNNKPNPNSMVFNLHPVLSAQTPNAEGQFVVDDVVYDLEEIRQNKLLRQLRQWDYPIFDLATEFGERILSVMAYSIFLESGISETFRIPVSEFLFYFHALENGYCNLPYHNRVHAADVLHGVYYLTTHSISGFASVVPSFDTAVGSSGSPSMAILETKEISGILDDKYPPLELMALYTAAAMHDYDHPGRTNAFLIATKASLAVLYKDSSVLENHHLASSWSLYFGNPNTYNYLRNLSREQFQNFRYLVNELILATDLKRHFELIAEFNAMVAKGIDWSTKGDRLLVLQMIIKLADIGSPCKARDTHKQWTGRIVEEFHQQGEEETRLGLPISLYMDRKAPQVAQMQAGFIKHLVAPLCNAIADAGLLHEEKKSIAQSGGAESDASGKETETTPALLTEQMSSFVIKDRSSQGKECSMLEKNLEDNYIYWVNQMKEEMKNGDNSSDEQKSVPEGTGATTLE